jgi:hypothetical protein
VEGKEHADARHSYLEHGSIFGQAMFKLQREQGPDASRSG